MTKGVPKSPRTCHRCGLLYSPTSGPQKFCDSCRQTIRYTYNKDWRVRHPEQRRLIDNRAIARKPDYYRALKKYCHYRWRENLRCLVFGHYSNQTFKCACCGESEQDFLVIDHINGRGNEHRRTIFGQIAAGGYRMHRWLVKEGFPEGFQLLCANCNTSKGKHGECVHKKAVVVPLRPIRSDKKPL
jgi:hypothetical protein